MRVEIPVKEGRAISGEIVVAVYDQLRRPVEALVATDSGEHLRFGFDERDGYRYAACLEIRNPAWGDELLTRWPILDQHPAEERHFLFNSALRLVAENGAALDGHRLQLMGWQVIHELPGNPFDGAHDGAMAEHCYECGRLFPNAHRCGHLLARETLVNAHNQALLERVRARRAGCAPAQVRIARPRHD